MLTGERVLLRPVERDDVERLHLWGTAHDVWPLVSATPYAPTTVADALKEYDEGKTWRPEPGETRFAVDADGELVGAASLWGIDRHNRRAHLGIELAPEARGRGLGRDVCRVLLGYAFSDLGLHRVQLEVLATNPYAIRSYLAAGFVEEGRTRDSAWVEGRFVDEVIMAALAPDPVGSPPTGDR